MKFEDDNATKILFSWNIYGSLGVSETLSNLNDSILGNLIEA